MSDPNPAIARTAPLQVEDMAAFHSPAGGASTRLDIEGVAVELTGLPERAAEMLQARLAPWSGPGTGRGPALRLEVVSAPVDYFIAPAASGSGEVYRVLTDHDGVVFRATSYRLSWWFDVGRSTGRVVLARGEYDPAPRALENMLRSAVAWLALERGGLFVHGAGIVRDGKCRIFYGPSGAGKSTLSSLSRHGQVLSDDLVLLLRGTGGLLAAGAPFRGTYTEGGPVVGHFPVAGLYRIRKDDRSFVRNGDAGCFADLIGNLPWVVDQVPRHPSLFDRARRAVEGVPFFYLHFRKDEDFWPAVEAGPESR